VILLNFTFKLRTPLPFLRKEPELSALTAETVRPGRIKLKLHQFLAEQQQNGFADSKRCRFRYSPELLSRFKIYNAGRTGAAVQTSKG
jgi:hypothetical protein